MFKYLLLFIFPLFSYADHSPKIGAEVIIEAQKLMAQGIAVVDIRQEACEGYIKGANLISIDDILSGSNEALEQISKLTENKTKPLAVYCRSGGRAGKVISYLKSIGYKDLHNLGGLGDYFDANAMQKCGE